MKRQFKVFVINSILSLFAIHVLDAKVTKQANNFPNAENIYISFLNMRSDLKKSAGSFSVETFTKAHGLNLNSEDKRFLSNVVLWGSPSPTLLTSYNDGIISWKDKNEVATINLRELDKGRLIINETTIQLDLTNLGSFKDTYKANSPKIKKVLIRDAIAKMSFFEVIVKLITMPFAHADQTDGAGCSAKGNNDTGTASAAVFKGINSVLDAPFKAVGYVTKPICDGISCLVNGASKATHGASEFVTWPVSTATDMLGN